MKTIRPFSKTNVPVLFLSTILLFVQCSSGDYKENKDTDEDGETKEEARTDYNEEEAMYPAEKVMENTNLTDDEPLELKSDQLESLDKKILLATLNRQKTLVEERIEALKNSPESATDNSTIKGNIVQLVMYRKKLSMEIAKVRNAGESELEEVSATAQAAIKGAGTIMQSNQMDVDRGF